MSATNRGGIRHPDDFYETPAWAVRRFLDGWHVKSSVSGRSRWLEPSAGGGAIVSAVESFYANPPRFVAIDINPRGFGIGRQDFLSADCTTETPFNVCIGNPPYKLAMEFIEKGLQCATEVCYLLRLNFLEGAKRNAFLRANPCDVYVLPNRPSFTEDGHTDATAYAWMVFGGDDRGRLTVLKNTPSLERVFDAAKRPRVLTTGAFLRRGPNMTEI